MYDLAFSFAGEHREYVEQTKNACEQLGLSVFYDRDKNNEWWGKNFIEAYSAILIGGASPQLNRGLTRSTWPS